MNSFKQIKKALVWFLILTKRALKKPSIIILALIMPIFALATTISNDITLDISLKVGIYIPDSDKASTFILKELNSYDKFFDITVYDDYEKLKIDVYSSNLSCGYAFSPNLSLALNECSNMIFNEQVECLTPETSNVYMIVNELIYSAFARYCSYDVLLKDTLSIKDTDHLKDEFINSKLNELYNTYLKGDDTFSVLYTSDINNITKTINIYNYLEVPIKAFIGVLIFAGSLLGSIMLNKDKANNTFSVLNKTSKRIVGFIVILIPTLIIAISGFIAIMISNLYKILFYEIIILITYAFICTTYAYILKSLFKNVHTYSGIVLMFLIGSLVFCPIFVNISTFIPAFKVVQLFFPPNYYLNMLL